MRSEGFREKFFVSQHLGGLIGMFLAAFITPNHQGPGEGRPRREGICHAEGDSVAIKLIFLVMELMVFADYHPAVFACVPHACLPEDIRPLVAGNQRCESQLSLSAGASTCNEAFYTVIPFLTTQAARTGLKFESYPARLVTISQAANI